ncbi:MAG: histidine kinase [Lachnospiraceae bacterium]|nr:histidine kinase [Lachnospiraceae bacterium]
MLKKITSGYYSKLLLICIILVCTVTTVLFALSGLIIEQQERSAYLKNYDIAISNLSSSLASKQSGFANTLAPIYTNTTQYQSLCDLYRNTLDELPQFSKTDIINILAEICRYDQYCCGVLLITNTDHLYQYDARYQTLDQLDFISPPADQPFSLRLFSDAQLDALSSTYAKPADHVYGLGGTIFDYADGTLANLGQIIVLYSTSEFTNILADAHLQDSALFTITDQDRNIFFASDDNYTSSDALIFSDTNTFAAPTSNTIQTSATAIKSENTTYYHATTYNGRYDFFTDYQISADHITTGFTQSILLLLAVLICAGFTLLYTITLRMSDRRIKTIQAGMALVGQNNLDHRLPVPRSNDEFTQITLSFNRMCDELQQNVEKAYVYEISQHKAELYAMQTSINPHFLYNALEQIRVQIMKGRYSDASQMLLLLSKMYRNQTRRNLYVSIGEECSQCENLINIYMYRYGNFEYEVNIEGSIKIYGIPKNTLQPLIENYFVHGMRVDCDDNLLMISAHAQTENEQKYLVFTIEDNGSSITEEELSLLKKKLSEPVLSRKEDNGFALSNVNSRLKLVFGEDSCLQPQVGENGIGFKIVFRIPCVLPEDLE